MTIELTPKQSYVMELLEDRETEQILAGGAAGGGKSLLICVFMLKMALRYPGCRLLIGRNELKRLKETTLVTFLQVAKMQGVKINKHFIINNQDNFIQFSNGSKIILMDLSYQPRDPEFERLGSYELTAAAIDEASEVQEKAKDILTSRLRWKLEEYGVTPKLLLTCNPHKGWLYRTFFRPWRDGVLEDYKAFVPILATDNPNLSSVYIRTLRRLPDADRERLLFGNWDYDNDPAKLIDFVKICDLWTNTFVPSGECFLTADIAMLGSDKFTIFVWVGLRVVHIEAHKTSTGKEVEYAIKNAAENYSVPRSNIIFDNDGLGAFLGSYLEGAVPFSNGGRPLERHGSSETIKENYSNLKTQTSYELARHVQENKIFIETPVFRDEITQELAWIKRDRMDKDGKLYLLSKEEVKKHLGRSPDFADAMHMRMWFVIDREKDHEPRGAASDDNILGHGVAYHADRGYDSTDGY